VKAKTHLARAYKLDLKINTKLEQVEHLRSLAYKVTSALRQDKVSGSSPQNSMEEAVIKIIMAEQAINAEIDRYIDLKNEITDTISLVANEDERLLLELRYLCYNSWEQIAVKLHICISYAYQLHRRALDSLDGILAVQRRYENG
jgi:DNA-directed RNA polymerase specialized sigma subunit